ncbi:hypothetical protein AYO40_01045 [Planctomycetaceae bacterium SCGC AG-212-D15]|nr:hypothetical protein AYO40_01045 [Planctomycetaceae bacterium SCGC AG-212-D15]
MAKLNQIIAVASGKKATTQKALTELHHKLQKDVLFQGIARRYQPVDDNGEKLPPEDKQIQLKTAESIEEARTLLTDLIDVIATQDYANTYAKADIVIDGNVIAPAVPVTTLLYLEKQLIDIGTFVEKLPTLDPAETWNITEAADSWKTIPYQTTRTKKVLRNHVKAEATKEHPAQVDVYAEDVVVGNWTTVKFSSAIPVRERNEMLARVRRLQEAVKLAREEANGAEAKPVRMAKGVLDYIFG